MIVTLTIMERASVQVRVVVRGGVEPPTFRFSGGRSYQLSYLTVPGTPPISAVLTGFEPATSTLTGWRALRAALQDHVYCPPTRRAVPPTGFEPVPRSEERR